MPDHGQEAVTVIDSRGLTKDHEFLRVWTDAEGLMYAKLDLPADSSGRFGDREQMLRLKEAAEFGAEFLRELVGAIEAAVGG